ncbi:MAG: hydrogenase maturation nickel metallochaperone HypA [Pirellulales bacterium]|nr:hydrogenase maturation nickel metallochaperone HypA [Pirellulales bacterium]
MHELSIVEALIEQVQREVDQAGQHGRILGLELVIGHLSGVNVDSIRFAFELLAPETILKDAELRIDEPRAICRCHDCGQLTEIDELVATCPRCGSGDILFEGGQELLLQSIELEDN